MISNAMRCYLPYFDVVIRSPSKTSEAYLKHSNLYFKKISHCLDQKSKEVEQVIREALTRKRLVRTYLFISIALCSEGKSALAAAPHERIGG